MVLDLSEFQESGPSTTLQLLAELGDQEYQKVFIKQKLIQMELTEVKK